MGKGNIHDRDEALLLFKDGLNKWQVAKRLGCSHRTASKIRWELIARGKLDDLEDPMDRELEDQSFKNMVGLYAEELRDNRVEEIPLSLRRRFIEKGLIGGERDGS